MLIQLFLKRAIKFNPAYSATTIRVFVSKRLMLTISLKNKPGIRLLTDIT
jgi:hypothetical protein